MLTSFSPSSGSYNQLITINGDRFGTVYRPVVKFGNVQAYVNSWSNTQITVYVPNTLYGPVKISVTSATQTVESATDFMIQNPHITGFTPQSGTFGDQITISGKYFVQGGTSVYINGYNASLISSTETEIIAKVPTQVDSIPNIVSISTIRGTSASATEKFTLLPPEIYSVSPLTLSPGGEVTITGNNFNTDSNKEFVFVDMVKLRITSATKTRIVAVAPAGLPRGSFRLKLQVNGYTRFSGSFVSINSQWLPIPSPMIRTTGTDNRPTVRIAAAGFSDRGYLCSLTDGGDTYRFDGNTKTWTKLSAKPAGVGGSMYNAKSVACNGSLFLVYGTAPVFTAFNPATESWTSINKNLGYNEYAATFALNNKIYFGTNAYLSGYPFYEIDPLNSF
ncbi:MAG TPA: IPT/TIG domain-containing protein, partial [Bacteroidales bacterium]|nr:IPT/TIG domain-containing protein [Bacteroidales bacterium]